MVSMLLQIMKQTIADPPNYSVLGTNCTSFAIQTLLKIGVMILPQNSNCTVDGYYTGYGMKPQDLNEILNESQNGNVFENRRRIHVPHYYVDPTKK